MEDQEYEKIEQKHITVTQFYQDFKKAFKHVCQGILVILALFVLWKMFSFWFFAGVVVSAIPLAYLVIHITKVPRTLVLSMHIAEGNDDADYFAMYGVPDKMLEQFNREGGDFHYITTLEGTQIAVCDSINFDEWTIKTPWFSELSNLEFFRTKQAFLKLKSMYVDEIKDNGTNRSLHSALVYKAVQDELKKHYTKFDQVMLEPEIDLEDKTAVIADAEVDRGNSLEST